MKPDSFIGERQAAGVRPRALQRALRRRARHAADVGAGAEEVRHDLARSRRCGRASASPRNGFTVDKTFFDSVEAVKTYFDDIPSTAAIYLDADGSSKDVGTRITQPRHGQDLPAASAARASARASTAAPWPTAMAKAATQPPTAADADHTWRPGLMTTDDLKRYTAPEREADRELLPRAERLRDGPAVLRRHAPSARCSNILGGYTPAGASREEILHRYLEASRYTFADRNALPRRPGVLRRPRRGPALDVVRRRAPRADHGQGRERAPSPAGDPYDNQGSAAKPAANTATISHPRQSTTHLTVADKQRQRRVLHVHDRVHGRQRHRRPGLRVPAQQRADRLQLRLDDAPEPRGGLQAPAQLDGADDHREEGQAVPGPRLAGRLDHPRHGAPDDRQPDRPA